MLYTREGLSCQEIAQSFGITPQTVRNYLKAYGIPVRGNSQTKGGLSTNGEIEIQPLISTNSEATLTRQELIRLYHGRGLSQKKIAETLQVPRSTIMWLFTKYDIPTRSRSEAQLLARSGGRISGQSIAQLRESIFSRWSRPMAYLLGLIFTDGHLRHVSGSTFQVVISSID